MCVSFSLGGHGAYGGGVVIGHTLYFKGGCNKV